MRTSKKSRVACLTGIFLLAGAMLLASCHSSNAKRYRLEGHVLSVNKAAGFAEIDSKEIPGIMPAMAMQFAVPDANTLAKLSSGDQITATLVVSTDGDGGNSSHLENIAVIHKAP